MDDGTVIRHTLELKRPEKRRPAWQEVAVGKAVKTIKVTVLSNFEPAATVNWGGLAEIAVLTPADLDKRLTIPGHDAAAPTFVHKPPLAVGTPPRVRLPSPARPGEHPRLLLTRAELTDLKAAVGTSDRGRTALRTLLSLADGMLTGTLAFPDPKGPLGQMTDRGDAVAKQHSRLSLNAGTLGVAHALSGDVKYARRAREILLGYAERYNAYPEHKGVNKSDTGKVMGQRLSEAMWLIPLIESYDYTHGSGVLTDAEKKQIEEQLIRPAITFIWRKTPAAIVAERDRANPDWRTVQPAPGTGKAVGNWLNYYNAATMMAGAVMGDRDMMDLAAANFRQLLAEGIGSDGMWGEGAIGYQFFALTAMVTGLEAAARQGIDLWRFGNNRVKMLFDSPLRYAYPDGSAPGINDSGRSRFGNWSTMVYDYAFLRYGDPTYAFLVNASPRQLQMSEAVYFPTRIYESLPEPKAAAYPSTVFENLGYSILRRPNIYALMDYGPHGGVHGHYDKLNLILFMGGADGKGDEMGGEPRFHRYEESLHDEWTKQTVAHNTMSVDETSQVASEGKLLIFEAAPTLQVMRAETTASAPGALLDRTVVVTPDAVLDLFHGRSSYHRTWDRTLRFQGKLQGLPAASANALSPKGRDGYQHLRIAARQPAAQGWKGTWQTTAGTFNVVLAGAPGQQVMPAHGPDNDEMAIARQEGERADFTVAYGMDAWSNPVQSLRQIPAGDSNTTATEMTQKDGTVTTVIVAHGRGEWQALGWRSDARVFCVRRKGANVEVLLTGGTQAVGKEGVIRHPAAGNYYARGRSGNLEVGAAWTPNAREAAQR